MFNIFRNLIILCLLFLKTTNVIAVELQAHIEPIHVVLGETATLIVQLINDSSQQLNVTSEPDITTLSTDFTVYGPSTSQYTQSINGVTTQQISWQYTLEPNHVGTLTIPAIAVQTSQGPFQSQAITMTVGKSANAGATPHLTASVSNSQPYLHQPIYYTLRLYHSGNISDLEAILPENGVLMETLPNAVKKTSEIVDGQAMDVLEVTYLLTPLRSGDIQLTPGKIKGLKVERDSRRQRSDIDFFLGYNNARPFTLSSDPLTLQIKAAESQPWLPAQNLQLTEKWETDTTQTIQAGTPIIRTLTIHVDGVGGQPLTSVENLLQDNVDFKVRAPKPESKRTFTTDDNIPVTEITQTFSIIPLHAGDLNLPAIRIPWWNLKTNQMAWAELPAKTIKIIENQTVATTSPPVSTAKITATTPDSSNISFSLLQYILLMISLCALLFALIYSYLLRRTTVKTVNHQQQKTLLSYKMFKSRLNTTNTLEEIIVLIQNFAEIHWQLPANSSLQNIGLYVAKNDEKGHIIMQLLKQLDAALYGQQTIVLTEWRNQFEQALPKLQLKQKNTAHAAPILVPLNP